MGLLCCFGVEACQGTNGETHALRHLRIQALILERVQLVLVQIVQIVDDRTLDGVGWIIETTSCSLRWW